MNVSYGTIVLFLTVVAAGAGDFDGRTAEGAAADTAPAEATTSARLKTTVPIFNGLPSNGEMARSQRC
ncbi:MAG: hypothetical protein ACXWNL_17045, partial [Vulcanimicrobiaceae bacterium]